MAYFEDGHGFGKSRSLKKKPNFQTVVQRWATVILLCLSCTPTLEVRGQLEKEVVRAADTVDSVKHMPGGGGGGFTVPGGGGLPVRSVAVFDSCNSMFGPDQWSELKDLSAGISSSATN